MADARGAKLRQFSRCEIIMQMQNILTTPPAGSIGAKHVVVDKRYARVSHRLAKRRVPQQVHDRGRAIEGMSPEFVDCARQYRL